MEDVCDPCGGAGGIGDQIGAIGQGEVPAELGNDIVIHSTLAEPTQGENDLGALRVFRVNEARGNVPEHDFGFAATDAAIGSGGEVPAAHGNLVAEPKDVCRVGPGWKHVTSGLALDKILHGVVAGAKRTERRVVPRYMVKAAARTADETAFEVAGKGIVHRRARPEIKEIQRSPDTILRPRPNSVEDSGVNRINVLFHGGMAFREKLYSFFCRKQEYLGEVGGCLDKISAVTIQRVMVLRGIGRVFTVWHEEHMHDRFRISSFSPAGAA